MKRFISALTAIAYSVLCLLPVSAEGLSSYDPRDTDMVSSARSQGKSGACWAFAAVACIEQELITKGEENASVDLSEAALIAASGGEEPFSQAGSAAQAELTLAAGKGLCFEQFEPFIGSKPEAAVVSDEKAEVMEYSLSRAYEIDKADLEFPNDLLWELDQMEFTPIISPDLKEMDARIFREEKMGLTIG